jgi:hypothetical protein
VVRADRTVGNTSYWKIFLTLISPFLRNPYTVEASVGFMSSRDNKSSGKNDESIIPIRRTKRNPLPFKKSQHIHQSTRQP